MAVLSILPTTQLTGDDIRDTINSFGGSADNHWPNYYQANDANKWSKWKPVKYPSVHTTGNENPPFWKASDGCCGFVRNSILFGVIDDLVAAYKSGATFVYDPPTGGTYEPLRGGDWRNYNKNAKSPVWSHEISGMWYTNDNNSAVTSTCLGNNDVNPSTNLVMGDLLNGGLSGYYYGVIAIGSNGATRVKTAAEPIGSAALFANNSVSLTYSDVSGLGGKVTIYPAFFSMKSVSATTNGASGTSIIACPDMANGNAIVKVSTQQASPWQGDIAWVIGSVYWSQGPGKQTFGGQIAYRNSNPSLEGTNIKVSVLKTNGNSTVELSTETVTLTKDSSDGNRNFMSYTYSRKGSYTTGDIYSLRLTAADGTTDTLICEEL